MPRSSGKTMVERCKTLNVYTLIRSGMLSVGDVSHGIIRFPRSGDVSYAGFLADDGTGGMLIRFKERDDNGEWCQRQCSLRLATTEQPFGGRRWWFVCPRSGRLVSNVHMAPWGSSFASRAALGLDYACQRESARDRALRRMHKARDRLEVDGADMGDPPRPKWMQHATFERLRAKLLAEESRAYGMLASALKQGIRENGKPTAA